MIIYGKAIRHKMFKRIIVVIFIIILSLVALSCGKDFNFDPKTSTLKYLFKKNKK
tara:strand:- start:927 stop:1091 length:165 start_codon:yes stop_codon:yes gene_type:complete